MFKKPSGSKVESLLLNSPIVNVANEAETVEDEVDEEEYVEKVYTDFGLDDGIDMSDTDEKIIEIIEPIPEPEKIEISMFF